MAGAPTGTLAGVKMGIDPAYTLGGLDGARTAALLAAGAAYGAASGFGARHPGV